MRPSLCVLGGLLLLLWRAWVLEASLHVLASSQLPLPLLVHLLLQGLMSLQLHAGC